MPTNVGGSTPTGQRRFRKATDRLRTLCWLSALLLVCATSCDRGPRLYPAQGVVRIDGKPLPYGTIQFAPMAVGDNVNPGKAAHGTIQPDGTFVLGTERDDDGVLAGPHRVVIFTKGADKPAQAAEIAPKFDVLRLIEQSFVVKPDEPNQFTIELTSDFVRKFGESDD